MATILAYASVLDMKIAWQKEMLSAKVFHDLDSITDHDNPSDDPGMVPSRYHLKPAFKKNTETVTKIVRGIA